MTPIYQLVKRQLSLTCTRLSYDKSDCGVNGRRCVADELEVVLQKETYSCPLADAYFTAPVHVGVEPTVPSSISGNRRPDYFDPSHPTLLQAPQLGRRGVAIVHNDDIRVRQECLTGINHVP